MQQAHFQQQQASSSKGDPGEEQPVRKGSKVRRPSLTREPSLNDNTNRDLSPASQSKPGGLSLRERRKQMPGLALQVTKESRKDEVSIIAGSKNQLREESDEPQAHSPVPEPEKQVKSVGDHEPLSPLRRARPDFSGNQRPMQMALAKESKLFILENCPASPKSPKKRSQWKDAKHNTAPSLSSLEPMSPLRKARPDWQGNGNKINMMNIKSTKMAILEGCPASPKSTKKKHKAWKSTQAVSHSIMYEPLSPLRRSRPHWTGNQKVLELTAKGTKVVVMEDYPASPKSTRKKRSQWASKEVSNVSTQIARGRQMSKDRDSRKGSKTHSSSHGIQESNMDHGYYSESSKKGSIDEGVVPLTQAQLDQLAMPSPIHWQ